MTSIGESDLIQFSLLFVVTFAAYHQGISIYLAKIKVSKSGTLGAGCKNCANMCPKTFDLEDDYGRARAVRQGMYYLIQHCSSPACQRKHS